jgi:hypothetical protein
MAEEKHFLEQLAMQWKHKEEEFFLDVDFSNDYLMVDLPVGEKHAWQIDKHHIQNSENLETIFETHYRNEKHDKIVPLFNMISEMFGRYSFPPANLDLGVVTLYSEAKFTDVIKGVEGNFGNQGWVISKKLFNILKNFNIGKYQDYKIVVQSKKQKSNDYVYLHFYSFADQFVDYSKSKFYKQAGSSLNFESRELIDINSFEEIEEKKKPLNVGLNFWEDKWTSIKPKEIFLKNNDLDLFKFKKLSTIDYFMSVKLAKVIYDEKITGFELFKTTKVKDS